MKAFVLVMLCVLCLGCAGSQPSRAERQASATERQREALPGSYACEFEVGLAAARDSSCSITTAGSAMNLAMAGAEHQLSGTLTPTDAGFHLVGDYRCATQTEDNQCEERIETDFFEQKPGTYHGVIALEGGTLLNVTLTRQ